jgi:hypothetical protein
MIEDGGVAAGEDRLRSARPSFRILSLFVAVYSRLQLYAYALKVH